MNLQELRRIVTQVLSEHLSLKAFREGNQVAGYIKEYPELGYVAKLIKVGSSPVQTDFWGIKTLYEPRWAWEVSGPNGAQIGYLYETGIIKYDKNDGNDELDYEMEPFDKKIDIAVRYMWLKRQRPLA